MIMRLFVGKMSIEEYCEKVLESSIILLVSYRRKWLGMNGMKFCLCNSRHESIAIHVLSTFRLHLYTRNG